MIRDVANIMRKFEQLIDLLHDEGVDPEIIEGVESAKEMFEEELDGLSEPTEEL